MNADAAETRLRILESATRFFSERGARSSVREIAKGAGVSLGMVHHYFGSKEELYAACIGAMYAELGELRGHLSAELEERMASGGRPSDVSALVDSAVRATFQFARSHQSAMRLMMRSVVARGALDEGRADEFLLPFLEQGSTAMSAVTGSDPASLRLPLQSLVFLNGRYAIAEVGELMLVTATSTPEAAVAAVENHLVTLARQLLGMQGD